MLGKFSCCLPSLTLPPAHLEELLENKGALDWDVPKLQSAARGNRGGGRSVSGVNGLMGTKQPACPSVEAPSPYGISADCKRTWAVPPPALAVPQLPLLCPPSFSLHSSVLTPCSLFASLLQTLHLPNSLHVCLYRGVTKTWYKDIGIFTLFPFFLFSHLFTQSNILQQHAQKWLSPFSFSGVIYLSSLQCKVWFLVTITMKIHPLISIPLHILAVSQAA